MRRVVLSFSVLLLFLQTCLAHQPIKQLAMEGGGIRGIAYLGAISAMQEAHLLDSLQQIAGTSAGGVMAALMGVGYDCTEMQEILNSTRFQHFNDNELGFITGFYRLYKRMGWYKGNRFERWIESYVAAKTGKSLLTFQQLHELHLAYPLLYKDVLLTATDLLSQRTIVLSYKTYPDMPISKAVRMTMSIPFYFTPVPYSYHPPMHPEITQSQLLVDGGVLMNYPIKLFDDTLNGHWHANPFTIGLRLDDSLESIYYNNRFDAVQHAYPPIHNVKDYSIAFYKLLMGALSDKDLTPDDAKRTIRISSGSVGEKIKKLSSSELNELLSNGKNAVINYYRKN